MTNNLSIIISIIAIGFSVFVYFIDDRKLKKQQKMINEQQKSINDYQLKKEAEEEVEREKASLICVPHIYENHYFDELEIKNYGLASAYNIKVVIKDEKREVSVDNDAPYEKLLPYQFYSYRYRIEDWEKKRTLVIIYWDDDFEKNRKQEIYVDI